MLWIKKFGIRDCILHCINTQSLLDIFSTLLLICSSKKSCEVQRSQIQTMMRAEWWSITWLPTYSQLIQITPLSQLQIIMEESPLLRYILGIVREYPSASSIFVFSILSISGYLISVWCIGLLRKYIGNRDQGLSEEQIRKILQQQRQKRLQKESNKLGKPKALSKQEEQQLNARVSLYKAKISELIKKNQKKQ